MLNINFNLLRKVLNSGRKNLKIGGHHGVKNASFMSVRQFSTFDNIKQKNLVEVAEKELEEIQKSYEPVQKSEKEDYLSKNSWVIFEYEKENKNYLELKKSQDEYDITVRFTAKPPEIPSESRGKGDFYVTLQKNNTKLGLFAECTTVDSSININQIHFAEDVVEYAKSFFSGRISQDYCGPEFSLLDERLQQEFLEIFLNLGIDDNLGSFIEVLSVDKEQKLYINWLKNVINVLH